MLTAGLIILSLLCAGAALAALRMLRSSEGRRALFYKEREELTELLSEERRKVESLEARLAAPSSEEARRTEEAREAVAEEAAEDEEAAAEDERPAVGNVSAADETDVYALATTAETFFNTTTHPRELLEDERFLKCVELLRGSELSARELLARGRDGENVVLGCMALEALARRPADETVSAALFDSINFYYYWPRFFALRALDAHTRGPLLARLLPRLNSRSAAKSVWSHQYQHSKVCLPTYCFVNWWPASDCPG